MQMIRKTNSGPKVDSIEKSNFNSITLKIELSIKVKFEPKLDEITIKISKICKWFQLKEKNKIQGQKCRRPKMAAAVEVIDLLPLSAFQRLLLLSLPLPLRSRRHLHANSKIALKVTCTSNKWKWQPRARAPRALQTLLSESQKRIEK